MRLWNRLALAAAGVCMALPALGEPGDLELQERQLELPDGRIVSIDWGTLEVPENRLDPDTRTIKLAFARVQSMAENPASPVIYLAGGPGGSSTGRASSLDSLRGFASVIETCDLIFLDQRGTGLSEPNMRVMPERLETNIFRSREDAVDALRSMADHAKREIESRGIDLHGYDSVQAADDINDVRMALGYDKVSLLGFSYGTHLAQVTMRRHGEHLDGVVLAGVEGLDQTYKLPLNMDTHFRKLAMMAARDPGVGKDVPDLVELYQRVSARLATEPMIVPANHPATGERIEIPVGAHGLAMILRFDMGDNTDLPMFPKLLHSIDQGDTTILSWFVNKRLRTLMGLNAMFVFTDGAAGASPGRFAMIEDQASKSMFGDAMNFPFPDSAEIWGVHDLGEEYRAPLVSDVRTLLLSGTLDWNCPPFQSEQLKWGLINASHICVENAGHEQILPHPNVQDAIVRFLKGQRVESGIERWDELRFVPIRGIGGARHPSVPEPIPQSERSIR